MKGRGEVVEALRDLLRRKRTYNSGHVAQWGKKKGYSWKLVCAAAKELRVVEGDRWLLDEDQEIRKWLKEVLGQDGQPSLWHDVECIKGVAEEKYKYSWYRVCRVAEELGVVERRYFGGLGAWSLPTEGIVSIEGFRKQKREIIRRLEQEAVSMVEQLIRGDVESDEELFKAINRIGEWHFWVLMVEILLTEYGVRVSWEADEMELRFCLGD